MIIKVTLYAEKENAIIEFLFKQDISEIDIIDIGKSKVFSLDKKYNIIPMDIKYKSKNFEIELTRNGDKTDFSIYLAYTIPPYNFFAKDENVNTFSINEKFSFKINEHYQGDIQLMTNGYYCIMIENFGEDVTLEIKNLKNKSLKGWKIAVIFSLLIIIL